MHRPAPAQWLVTRSRWLARVLLVLWLLGWVAMLTFFHTQRVSLESVLVWILTMMLVCGLLWQLWGGRPTGLLRWDGSAWYWPGLEGEAPCTVTLRMDLQRLLIVSVHRSGLPTVWLWLETFPGTTGWLSLRRAMVRTAVSAPADGGTGSSVSEYETR